MERERLRVARPGVATGCSSGSLSIHCSDKTRTAELIKIDMGKNVGVSGRRKHLLTDKMKSLSAGALAQKIGYLRVDDFSEKRIFDLLPRRSFGPRRLIPCKGVLCVVNQGAVQIRHSLHRYIVKELATGSLFGDMPLLGQPMLWTEAVSGTEGATVAIMSIDRAKEWIKADPVGVIEKIGPRLASIEVEHYRCLFQFIDSRVAALLLELAGEGSVVEGLTHDGISKMLGIYRETASMVISAMKADKLIETSYKRITVLDKEALRTLSEI